MDAKKGITKLMLVHTRSTIGFKTLSVTVITLATPLPEMEVVLSQPRTAQSTYLSELVQQTLELTRESDHLSIRSKYLSIKIIGKTICVLTENLKYMLWAYCLDYPGNVYAPLD